MRRDWQISGVLLGVFLTTGACPTLVYGQSLAQAGAKTITRSTLKAGSRGATVKELQATLLLLGYYTGEVNGLYDQATTEAVSRFQQASGLTVDGVVGPATWNRLFPTTSTVTSTGNPPGPSPTPPSPTPSSPTPSIPDPVEANTPTLRRGMRGTAVERLQQQLQAKGFTSGGVDGVFGTGTEAAVKAAQRHYGLVVDGVAGPATWEALESGTPANGGDPDSTETPILRRGSRGTAVERLQARLQAKGFLNSGADGVFGAATEAAVKAAQQRYGLTADGVVGPATWEALFR